MYSILENAGLTVGEAKVYLAMLEIGSSTTGPIVKKSTISRSIVYQILSQLMEKGLASCIVKEKTKYFQAAEPGKILEYLEQKRDELSRTKRQMESELPKLLQMREHAPESEARVYTGYKGVRTAHEHSYAKLTKGEEYYYLGTPAYQPEEQHTYWKRDHLRRIRAGIKCKLLFNRETKQDIIDSRNSFKGAEAKRMPTDITTPATFMIYKDTVVIILQHPNAIAIEIVNQDIANSFKAYFNVFWNQNVEVYHGEEGVKAVFEEHLNYKDVWFIGGNWGINKYFPEYWESYNKRRIEKKVFWHDLLVRAFDRKEYYNELQAKSEEEFQKNYFYEFRELPNELASPHVICFYGNKVANIIWGKETMISVIESKEMVEYYKKYFRLLWDVAGQKTKILHGKAGAVEALREVDIVAETGEEVLGFGTDTDDYLEQCPKALKEHFTKGKKHKIKQRLLFGEGFKSPNPVAKIRLLPKGFIVPVRTMIAGTKVFIVDFTDPITTIIIDRKQIADAYRKHFDYLWKMAKP